MRRTRQNWRKQDEMEPINKNKTGCEMKYKAQGQEQDSK